MERLGHPHALGDSIRRYNPYSYQTGSVWPHDNAIIALGFKRYGFGDEAARIARDISDAASHFLPNQLPELYTTPERNDDHLPGPYLGANVPQAWAAGSVFSLLQAILGFLPDAPRGTLHIDPALPAWLPDLTVIDLRVGSTPLRYPVLARGRADEIRGVARQSACGAPCQCRRLLRPGQGLDRTDLTGRRPVTNHGRSEAWPPSNSPVRRPTR